MRPTIISYSSVSSAKQLEGTGIEQQKDYNLLNQLSQDYGLPIDDRTFSDEGLSGFHQKNLQGDFGRILELINTGSIVPGSILAITSLDRISRAKTNEAMELMLSVINRGIRIYTAMDDKLYCSDSSNLTADLIVSVIIMAQAHEESLKKSHRTRGNALALVQQFQDGIRSPDGFPIAIKSVGTHPWWIDTSDGSVKPDGYYFPIAREIAQKMLDGIGVVRILDWLNDTYQPPPKRTRWSNSLVTRFPKNEGLTGTRTITIGTEDYRLDGYMPQVMTESEYMKLKAIKATRSHTRTIGGNNEHLGGLKVLKCSSCGGSLTHGKNNGSYSYRCINGQKNKAICRGMSVPARMVHEAVLTNLNWLNVLPAEPKESNLPKLKLELEAIEAKLNQMESDYLDSPSAILAKAMAQLEGKVKEKQSEIASERMHEVLDYEPFTELPEEWSERRRAIQKSFNAIRVHKLGHLKFLVSMYSKTNAFRHLVVHKNQVVQEGRFYHSPQAELDLIEPSAFMLFEADGRLNQWLEEGRPLDHLEFIKDEPI